VFATLYVSEDTTRTTTTIAAAPAPCGDQRMFGHIRSLVRRGDHYELRFDPAWFTSGQTANKAAAEDGVVAPGEPVPNDNYVVDESDRTLFYLVPATARVTVLTPAAYVDGAPASVDTLARLGAGEHPIKLYEGLESGFWMRFHNDTVCSLAQQYRP
jgi:hypothetical protein